MNSSPSEPTNIAEAISALHCRFIRGAHNVLAMGALPRGVTPHQVILTRNKLRLLHYKSTSPPSNPTPLIIVYSLLNRPYITDLQQDRSTIQGLLASGQDVYLVDWGYPDFTDRHLTLDDYLNRQLNQCVNTVCALNQCQQVNLLGICQGGVFSLCYSALWPEKVKNLVTMVTPVDFQTPDNMLSHWVSDIDVGRLTDTFGNIPGRLINMTFSSMKPYRMTVQKCLQLMDCMDSKQDLRNFMLMEQWINDNPDQASATFRQFVQEIVQQNKLFTGELLIGQQAIDLKRLSMPVFNLHATQDHLVPPAAAQALRQCVGTNDYTEMSFKGGHIGIFVSKKAQTTVTPAIGHWLNQRC